MLHLFLLAFQLAPAASPMVENTRAHTRQEQKAVDGERITTPLGEIVLPPGAKPGRKIPLVIHFHGAPWIAQQSVRKAWPKAAVLAVQAGTGSRVYGEAVSDPQMLPKILGLLGRPVDGITLTGYSAGYGAIRVLLRQPENAKLIQRVILLDGIHSSYAEPQTERKPLASDLDSFVDYAREAALGRCKFLILHTEIFPGNYASTTETTDWLLSQFGLRRKAVLRWGPLGSQILSDTRTGQLRVMGFAGNSAPDHVDLLHGLPWALKLVK